MIPQEIIDEYNLMDIIEDDGWCYAEIRKALYGLKEASYLSNVELKRILAEQGYLPSKFTPGLFTHKTRDIAFALSTDDFGIKYSKKRYRAPNCNSRGKISYYSVLGTRLLPWNDIKMGL